MYDHSPKTSTIKFRLSPAELERWTTCAKQRWAQHELPRLRGYASRRQINSLSHFIREAVDAACAKIESQKPKNKKRK